MKKFFRRLFSPLFFTALISAFEVLLLITVFSGTYYYFKNVEDENLLWIYPVIRVIYGIAAVLFFLAITNKPENPEYKIPWIVAIFITPYLAIALYLFFANVRLSKKDRKIISDTKEILIEKFKLSDEERNTFKEDIPIRYRSLFKYLRHVTHLESTAHNKVTYYSAGELFFPEFVKCLDEAKEFIFLEFFIIGEGKWWSKIEEILIRKAKEGVEVRVVYDDLGSTGVLPNLYHHKLRKYGIKCYKFHKFVPKLSGTYNNRDHRKIAIVDHKYVFTGGMNLADEYANEKYEFGYWKDTMVRVEGEGIKNFIATFLSNYDLCTHKLSDYDKYLDYDYEKFDEKGYIYGFGDAPGHYSDSEPVGEENYLQMINKADNTLWISTPYLIPTYRLIEALKCAAIRGVDVKLFVPGIPDKKVVYWLAKSNFIELTKAGVKVYTYTPGFNHEKEMVVDDILAFCGTINFDFRSLTHHFECGLTMYDTECIKDMVNDFKKMESVSELITSDYKVGFTQRLVSALINVFRPLL
ncbi:MAG: cardiolipin synthase [Gammaproteobacteria bacterium]|nr:cardiolipin synthase [Gammaproteobacteria bacterium]